MEQQPLAIALTKGRILKQTLPLLEAVGIEPAENLESTRKLQVDTNIEGTKLLLVRASDVPAYVEYGGADIGVTGKDILLEHSGRGLYEPLDLGFGVCQMVVAAKPNVANGLKVSDSSGQSSVSFDRTGVLRVATKYPEVARRYFDRHGQQVEIIKLYGSMELAPLVGMADLIVDIMETGATLIANDLEVVESICDISSRLIVNKASMKMKHQKIHQLIDGISNAV